MMRAVPAYRYVIMAWGALAVNAMPAVLGNPLNDHDAATLRAELHLQHATRNEAALAKTAAYRRAHELFKTCDRELRPFCMMSATKIMRDADLAYQQSAKRDFPDIAALERAVAAAEAAEQTAPANSSKDAPSHEGY